MNHKKIFTCSQKIRDQWYEHSKVWKSLKIWSNLPLKMKDINNILAAFFIWLASNNGVVFWIFFQNTARSDILLLSRFKIIQTNTCNGKTEIDSKRVSTLSFIQAINLCLTLDCYTYRTCPPLINDDLITSPSSTKYWPPSTSWRLCQITHWNNLIHIGRAWGGILCITLLVSDGFC